MEKLTNFIEEKIAPPLIKFSNLKICANYAKNFY